jgi:hypothetical protein
MASFDSDTLYEIVFSESKKMPIVLANGSDIKVVGCKSIFVSRGIQMDYLRLKDLYPTPNWGEEEPVCWELRSEIPKRWVAKHFVKPVCIMVPVLHISPHSRLDNPDIPSLDVHWHVEDMLSDIRNAVERERQKYVKTKGFFRRIGQRRRMKRYSDSLDYLVSLGIHEMVENASEALKFPFKK